MANSRRPVGTAALPAESAAPPGRPRDDVTNNVLTDRDGNRIDTFDKTVAHRNKVNAVSNDPAALATLRAEVDRVAAERARLRRP